MIFTVQESLIELFLGRFFSVERLIGTIATKLRLALWVALLYDHQRFFR